MFHTLLKEQERKFEERWKKKDYFSFEKEDIQSFIRSSSLELIAGIREIINKKKLAGGNYNCGEEGCCPKPEPGSYEEEDVDFQAGYNTAISDLLTELDIITTKK